jgi:hypothetical protein
MRYYLLHCYPISSTSILYCATQYCTRQRPLLPQTFARLLRWHRLLLSLFTANPFVKDLMNSSPLQQGVHFAGINGLTIHYYVSGRGPVMLIPSSGWGPSVNFVMPLPALERHCTTVYFDTRLSGQSTGPHDAQQYKLENFVADIEALRVYLGQDKIFVAGHSGGGHQVLAYGIAHSEHLLGLIAIDAIAAADGVRAEDDAPGSQEENRAFLPS